MLYICSVIRPLKLQHCPNSQQGWNNSYTQNFIITKSARLSFIYVLNSQIYDSHFREENSSFLGMQDNHDFCRVLKMKWTEMWYVTWWMRNEKWSNNSVYAVSKLFAMRYWNWFNTHTHTQHKRNPTLLLFSWIKP